MVIATTTPLSESFKYLKQLIVIIETLRRGRKITIDEKPVTLDKSIETAFGIFAVIKENAVVNDVLLNDSFSVVDLKEVTSVLSKELDKVYHRPPTEGEFNKAYKNVDELKIQLYSLFKDMYDQGVEPYENQKQSVQWLLSLVDYTSDQLSGYLNKTNDADYRNIVVLIYLTELVDYILDLAECGEKVFKSGEPSNVK